MRGIAHANQNLIEADFDERVLIEEVQFIELYEDRAIQAAKALARAGRDLDISRNFDIDLNLQIKGLRGGRKRASFGDWKSWRTNKSGCALTFLPTVPGPKCISS